MKDTFWTDELVKEYASLYIKESWEQLGELKKNITSIEQFKSSKAPKKEWEIVAYSFEPLKGIDKPVLVTQGSKYWESAISGDKDFPIHSVRRLSDGEIFSVGDRILFDENRKRTITSFSFIDGELGIYYEGGAFNSKVYTDLRKLPAPVLTTVDGVEIYKDQKYWVVESMEEGYIPEYYANENNKTLRGPTFSTREAAETYILNNLRLLSLNDVKEVLKNWFDGSSESDLITHLTVLVKQKLNQ